MKINYQFIGWAQDKVKNTDKVWTLIKLGGGRWDGKYVAVYGRRGKKLQTKIHKDADQYHMNKLIRDKERKGYADIDETHLSDVYPEFEKDLEKTAFWISMTT